MNGLIEKLIVATISATLVMGTLTVGVSIKDKLAENFTEKAQLIEELDVNDQEAIDKFFEDMNNNLEEMQKLIVTEDMAD